MEAHLSEAGFRHFRVRGLTPKEIYVPEDIERTWRTAACLLQTSWSPSFDNSNSNSNSNSITGLTGGTGTGTGSHRSPTTNHTVYTAALCGRGKKKNTPKELGCTTSHLLAMHQAIHSPTAKSRYALIVEDDVFFPFDIDFNALASSAPTGFGILQLFNSNAKSMERTWEEYRRSEGRRLWSLRTLKQFDYWSTCAYLIDRVVMKPIVNEVLYRHGSWWALKVVAGITSPCVPRGCCGNTSETSNIFYNSPPCVYAPQGYQADSFLYSMTQTQMINIPVIANGLGGNQSTFHQDHVEMLHRAAFRQQRGFINSLLKGETSPPSFIKAACREALDVNAI